MPTTRLRPPATILATLIATVALLTGCGGTSGETTPEERMDDAATLAARDSLEDTVARYETMQQQLRERLDAELGPFDWYEAREQSTGSCGFDFTDQPDARTVGLAPWAFNAPMPDWERATQIATEVIADYGFVIAGAQIDQGGLTTMSAFDTTLGAYFSFGTQVNTLFRTSTGCHLPRG